MGTAAKYNCSIEFRSPEDLQKFVDLFDGDITKTLADYHGEPCHIDATIAPFEPDHDCLDIEVFSERTQNADWQHELLIKFIREETGNLVQIFNSHGWLCTEGHYIDFDEEEDVNTI